jgi:hypothetical protein
MARIECTICHDCLTSDWTGPKCSNCGGTGHVTVRDEDEEAREEEAWEAAEDAREEYERLYYREA